MFYFKTSSYFQKSKPLWLLPNDTFKSSFLKLAWFYHPDNIFSYLQSSRWLFLKHELRFLRLELWNVFGRKLGCYAGVSLSLSVFIGGGMFELFRKQIFIRIDVNAIVMSIHSRMLLKTSSVFEGYKIYTYQFSGFFCSYQGLTSVLFEIYFDIVYLFKFLFS